MLINVKLFIENGKFMLKRLQIKFYGIVQGVGFRPFIFRLSKLFNLTGFVKNLSDCVVVEIEGIECNIEEFLEKVNSELPPLAKIEKVEKRELEIRNDTEFKILDSEKTSQLKIHISPDIAICNDCVKELFDKNNRRYRYPFINCTNCGPRLTIIKDIPYDRKNTSMSKFKMCSFCREEYENPDNRRFHAEPIACEKCGPKLFLVNRKGEKVVSKDEIKYSITLLKQGKIIAVKGIGGFHLAVDATNEQAVEMLRRRKLRESKAFAVMVKDLEHAKMVSHINRIEEKLLLSPQSPIVLLQKKENNILAKNIAPALANYGLILPYTPLHILLVEELPFIIMTSGNISDEPISIDNSDALERLKNIADYFLLHNRDILVRCDDSICAAVKRCKVIFRRSRGFAPLPIKLIKEHEPVLSLGGHMKNTICIIRDSYAFLSPHIGDMETPLSREFFLENIALMQRITEVKPEIVAVDMHPDYFSTRYAFENFNKKKIISVQHHHAHIVSCMAENRISGKVIGIALDGTGFGTDKTIWGGEVLVADETSFFRAGFIKNFLLIGGEVAVKQIWRIVVLFLIECFGDKWINYAREFNVIPEHIKDVEIFYKIYRKKINSIYTSSAGRLFDAFSSLLLGIRNVGYEAEAAMKLEAVSFCKEFEILPYKIEDGQIDFFLTFKYIVEQLLNGVSSEYLAASFHYTFVEAFVEYVKMLKQREFINRVVLSGGCFQNRILLEAFVEKLLANGFEVFFHREVPTNDGGLALGQAVIASMIYEKGG